MTQELEVLVTGASGFVGANVVEALLNAGQTVRCFDRAPAPHLISPAVRDRVSFITADITDEAACLDAAKGCKIIVHTAAVTPADSPDLAAYRTAIAVNLHGTLNAIAAAEAVGAHLVYLSSAAVYGATDGTLLDEVLTAPNPQGPYPISKAAAERIVLSRLSDGLSATILRIGSVFGPFERNTGVRDTISAIHQVTAAAREGRPIRLPREGRRDWIYARDVSAAIVRAALMPDPVSGPINIGLGEEWSIADWCRALARRQDVDWKIDPEHPNIDYYSLNDRPPLAVERMKKLLGFVPSFHIEEAQDDYLNWMSHRESA